MKHSVYALCTLGPGVTEPLNPGFPGGIPGDIPGRVRVETVETIAYYDYGPFDLNYDEVELI